MPSKIETIAASIRSAYTHGAIAPLRGALDPSAGEEAYAVQAINTQFWAEQGRKPVGHKVGLTSQAVQEQLGVDQPDYGVLFDDMQVDNGGILDPTATLQPKAEAEIALMLDRDILDLDADEDTVSRSTAFACAAIEIVDSRIADWKITFADTVADNGSSGFFVLGDARHPIASTDLYSCGMVMEINEKIVSLGTGAACFGHPLKAAAWLARTMVKAGTPLRAGEIILTGALGPMVQLTARDRVRANIGGIGECNFTYGTAP